MEILAPWWSSLKQIFFSKFGSMSWYMLKLKPFWALKVPFFGQHIFFIIGHYIRKYYKLRSICFTLGDALKIFFFCSFHHCLCPNNQKSPVELDFLNFLHFQDTLYYMHKISDVGLFCCDKFEETPKQKVIDLSKF